MMAIALSVLIWGFQLISLWLPNPVQAKVPTDTEKFNSLIAAYTQGYKHLDAFNAPDFGIEEDFGKFGDYPGSEFFDRTRKLHQFATNGLMAIHPEALSVRDQRAYKLFKESMEVAGRDDLFPNELLDFNQMGNRLQEYLDQSSQSLTRFPFDSIKHYEAFIQRSEGFPGYVNRQIDVLRHGIKQGIVLNCAIVKATLNTYQPGLEPQVEKNPFWRPILFLPQSIAESDRERLKAKFREMIELRIVPGFQKFDHFFRTEYEPHCRKEFGLASFPNGKAWYLQRIWRQTNLKLEPNIIHRIGLREVKRISSEMENIRREIGFKGSLQQLIRSLRHDPKYFFKSSQEMFKAFEKVKAQVASKIDVYFSLKPKSDYKIVESSNPETSSSGYSGPTDAQPFGRLIVSSLNLTSVPTFEVTTLSMHEAIPGHHFQLALAFEMSDQISEYQRRLFNSNAFVEGWALYAEYLGREMGAYSDPMQRLGNLNDEMLRAVRLVVDTGIHAYGWSQKRSVRYMSRYLAFDEKSNTDEVNRYSVLPAQALGYKIGELKVLELRRLAEKELGPRFNLREFHRHVIGNGTVSLSVLEAEVRSWIKLQQADGH